MGWLSDLFKHITISKPLTASAFPALFAVSFGYKWFPDYFQKLPGVWSTVVLGLLIFSGFLLAIWFLPYVWNFLSRSVSTVYMYFYARNLSDLEKNVILALAIKYADEAMNLRDINYENTGHPKLKVLDATYKLSKKGLVRLNSYDENLVSLTKKGRALGLSLVEGGLERGSA